MGSKNYSKGISWFSDCRIPFVDDKTQGRFPANILVSDDMLNDGKKPNTGHRARSKITGYGDFGGGKSQYHGTGEYMSVDSTSRYYDIDKWFDNLLE